MVIDMNRAINYMSGRKICQNLLVILRILPYNVHTVIHETLIYQSEGVMNGSTSYSSAMTVTMKKSATDALED